jgi:putative ABC transport system permease protein
VGTTPEIFTKFEYRQGQPFKAQAGGRFFDPEKKEAVLGAIAAEQLGLRVGSTFMPYHGLSSESRQQHQDVYTVVGVLEVTNSPSDRVIWIPIEGIYRMSGHVLRGTGTTYKPQEGEAIPDEHREVSAVMLKFSSPRVGLALDQTINRQGKVATLAWPIARSMAELFDRLGWVNRILAMVAYLVVVVATGSILASLYNTMNERRREFAILRALGARKRTVFAAIVLEATTITTLGALVGFLFLRRHSLRGVRGGAGADRRGARRVQDRSRAVDDACGSRPRRGSSWTDSSVQGVSHRCGIKPHAGVVA